MSRPVHLASCPVVCDRLQFLDVLPDQAIIYFSQVAAAAPGLRDISGWTASARYREVLVQYGDQLAAKKEWCNAQQQYELALSMGADATLQGKTSNAALQCSPPTGTPTETPSATSEIPTATFPPDVSPTPPLPLAPCHRYEYPHRYNRHALCAHRHAATTYRDACTPDRYRGDTPYRDLSSAGGNYSSSTISLSVNR